MIFKSQIAYLLLCLGVVLTTFEAICQRESGGNRWAYKRSERAAGIAQIRPIYVADVNRILGKHVFTNTDRWSINRSRQMFEIYTSFYIKHYRLADMPQNRARIHNGGPTGWRKQSTLKYWNDVRRLMR